ncbi:COX15/CtaA family protein [Marinicella sp. S1101]|uniref:COX15/CtaA family protein n=1 Tax=Marinicella marina TaxID=2996016 RepID=UPI002260FA3E|nr:COX15/CtaA family protein [Marinicella marina]MCX7552804.1 COX15/CtaA family protein [Marinicella marina]MDJ1139887.1 COX15/CtaA family protein [Marinicella marina]
MKYRHLAWFAAGLTLCVIILGGYVRLSDAGLGCPDWPGCYGHLAWPNEAHEIEKANATFTERAVEVGKAWREMVHRYLATILGMVAIALVVWAYRRRHLESYTLPSIILLVVIFQGMLGMWTVTWKLHPSIVMSHLIGGLTVLSLLVWLACSRTPSMTPYRYAGHVKQWMVVVGTGLLMLQIALGGWTSANYAALACVGFPQCNGVWWPEMDFVQALDIFKKYGPDYEFGVKDGPARMAIQMMHRIGAVVVTLYFAWLIFKLTRNRELMPLGLSLLLLLVIQITLGIINVTYSLPLLVATLHNGVAALLMANMVMLLYKTRKTE